VGKKEDKILEAYLGTCVGLTLYDKKADVGGMIHLLLPEPLGESIFGKLENYALTGVPIFLEALREKGARIDRLEACIAGGAFVGPLSETDLDLDIGGRTVEITERILKEKNIPIVQSETGGFFSCRMGLNLKTWENQIHPINMPEVNYESDIIMPTKEHIEDIILNLNPIPQIALKLLRMLREDIESLVDLAKEIRQDQVISAKLLRLCNSAYFHHGKDVNSIDRAVVILGAKLLFQILISVAFEDFFSNSPKGYSLCKGGLFKHALGTALISERVAEMTGKVSTDVAYTAGLLHDIGKVVLDQYMRPAYPLFYRKIQEDGQSLIDAEGEIFGITHPEAGEMLAEKWALPPDIRDVIRDHHSLESGSENADLIHIVYLSDLLMSRFMVGQELERMDTSSLVQRLHEIGLSNEDFPKLIENIPDQMFEISDSCIQAF
jgi:putative nucleotidyltransferase with HDIG domain